jgi:4-hydroxy-tetrahydrodipicolinate reductase
MTLAIAIAGVAGRMGSALARAASADKRFRVVGGTVRPGAAPPSLGFAVSDSAQAATAGADVWIDFTTPMATVEALYKANVRAAIIGTTGISAAEDSAIAEHAKRMAIVRSGNFSLGVNLLAALAEQAAQKLGPEWDIEISEAHHRRKTDAPSGTALLLGEAAAKGRGVTLDKVRRDNALGARPEGAIGFAVTRGGGIVGKHDVRFVAEREMVTLGHEAFDRAVFADGALAAALWAADKPPGLYSMRDVLGL